jgi:hypothetical protein
MSVFEASGCAFGQCRSVIEKGAARSAVVRYHNFAANAPEIP